MNPRRRTLKRNVGTLRHSALPVLPETKTEENSKGRWKKTDNKKEKYLRPAWKNRRDSLRDFRSPLGALTVVDFICRSAVSPCLGFCIFCNGNNKRIRYRFGVEGFFVHIYPRKAYPVNFCSSPVISYLKVLKKFANRETSGIIFLTTI